MKWKQSASLACLAALMLATVATAQTTGTPGVNDFTINGVGSGGTTPVDPGLISATNSVSLEVSGPTGSSVFGLTAASVVPNAFALPPVILGSLDLDPLSVQVWFPNAPIIPGFAPGNVIGNSGTWTLTAPVSFSGGETFNLQMALLDPTTGGFSLTQAQSGTVAGFTGVVTVLNIPGTTSGNLVLTVPITFYGVTYTSIDIASHGYIKFGNPWSDFSPSMLEFFGGFPGNGVLGAPGVAAAWCDYNPSGGANNGTYTVFEDTVANTVKVEFSNMFYFGTFGPEPAGTFSATFGAASPGSVTIDLTGFIPSLTSATPVIVGVTDGDFTTVPNTDLTNLGGFAGNLGVYTSPSAPDSIGELFPAATALPVSVINFIETGLGAGNGTWTLLP